LQKYGDEPADERAHADQEDRQQERQLGAVAVLFARGIGDEQDDTDEQADQCTRRQEPAVAGVAGGGWHAKTIDERFDMAAVAAIAAERQTPNRQSREPTDRTVLVALLTRHVDAVRANSTVTATPSRRRLCQLVNEP